MVGLHMVESSEYFLNALLFSYLRRSRNLQRKLLALATLSQLAESVILSYLEVIFLYEGYFKGYLIFLRTLKFQEELSKVSINTF